jgi:hypothetical protein
MELKRVTGRWRFSGNIFWQALILSLSPLGLTWSASWFGPTFDRKGDTLTPEQQNGKWGYVDATGKFLIPPQLDSAGGFSEGLAPVELNKRSGYISTDGHLVVQPKYFSVGPCSEGLAWVAVRKPWAPLGTGQYGMALFAEFT